MPPKAANRPRKNSILRGGDPMVEIQFPNKQEIIQALQTEEPTDRELWILKHFGGDQ